MTAVKRACAWAGDDPLMRRYHDEEWGVPLHDDRGLFEFLILEGAQAGLSWSTILRKRENYREAFAGFDPERVARFTARQRAALMKNPGIVRNRLKIDSAVTNAQAVLALRRERKADPEPPNRPPPRFHARIRRLERGPQEARPPVRGNDDPLRVHAGGRHGQRP
jgi:hypothetical protein